MLIYLELWLVRQTYKALVRLNWCPRWRVRLIERAYELHDKLEVRKGRS